MAMANAEAVRINPNSSNGQIDQQRFIVSLINAQI